MLQSMRDKFTGTFALVILGMLGVSFIFFGLNYSFIGSGFAAKVDGEEIDAGRFEQSYRDTIQRNPQWASLPGDQRLILRRNVLDQLVGEQLLENYLNENGYRISDAQVTSAIQSTSDFQVDGRFDMETYRTLLLQASMDPTRYEQLQRNALRQRQLQLSVGATAVVTPAEYRRYLNLYAEQRVVTTATITEADVADEISVTDEMISAYYQNNPSLFQLPESADVEYVEIRRDSVAESIVVTEDDLLAHYENAKDRYLQDEQRQARHILIPFGDDDDAAEAKAIELFARLQAGEPFADLAATYSADGGTASRGGDLGTLTRTQLPGELGSSIFSINEGDLDGPLQGDFGYHIVRLDKILARGPLPLEQVRGELLSELREQEAENLYRDLERTLEDALFDNSDMQSIAAAIGAEIQTVERFTRFGGGDLGSNQAVIDAVFDEFVLTDGQVSELIEVDANRSAIFKVTQHHEATRQPLEDVAEQVAAALTTEQAELILIARAEQALEALASGEEFSDAAAAAGLGEATRQLLGRVEPDVDQALLFDIFAAGKPTAESPVVGRVRLLSGGYTIYNLDAVLPGRPESIPLAERDEGKLQLAQTSGFGDFQALVKSLYDNADIQLNNDVLAAEDLFQ